MNCWRVEIFRNMKIELDPQCRKRGNERGERGEEMEVLGMVHFSSLIKENGMQQDEEDKQCSREKNRMEPKFYITNSTVTENFGEGGGMIETLNYIFKQAK